MPEILTPDEFDELAGEDQFNQEQNEAYRVLYEMHETALERIEAMKLSARASNEAIRKLNARLAEQDAIIAGAAKTMATLASVVDLADIEREAL